MKAERSIKMEYDYRTAMKADVLQAITEKEQWIGKSITEAYESKEEAYDQLFDDMFVDDSVTGNASGSYYCNAYKAEEAISHNWDILNEALAEFGYDQPDVIEKGAEWCDVIIRCHLLPGILAEALDEKWDNNER